MIGIPPEVLELAESMNVNLPQRPGEERIVRPGFAAIIGVETDAHHNVVQRLRLAPAEVEPTVREVRALFEARGRRRVSWEIGDSATPGDLALRCEELGMRPDEHQPLSVGMVLTRPLDDIGGEVVVREVTTFDEFALSASIFHRCFGAEEPPPDAAELRARYARCYEKPGFARYLAFAGGEPVATADAVFTPSCVVMVGGATLPSSRGTGAYRALVAARHEAGRLRGTPTLVTQAGAMSRPILARLGFEEVVKVHILLDAW